MQEKPQNFLLNVIKSPQSYRNIGYLFASFPLGLLYFLILIVGSSVGAGLAVIVVGIFILWGLLGISSHLANFERWVSNQLLKTNLPMQRGEHFNVRNSDNWRGVGYLALKFPLGLLTFIFTIFITVLTIGMILMPFRFGGVENVSVIGREIDTLWEAGLSSILGLMLLPFSIILLNKIALLWRNLNQNLLRVETDLTEKKKNILRSEVEQEILERLADKKYYEDEFEDKEKREQVRYSDSY
ncbi:MAG: hypothetical protein Phog2KO_35180 [Phototrophicaceae bacterium]